MKLSWIRKDQWVSKYEVKLNKKGSMISGILEVKMNIKGPWIKYDNGSSVE